MKNKKVNLNDICFFQEGPGVRKHQYCTKGVKLINVSNLVNGEVDLSNSNRYISQEEAYGRYKHFLIDEGDLIIASSGIKVEYLDKKVAFIKKENLPLCMNTSTIRFKVKNKNELDILYLSYFLKSKNFKNQISKLITGSAQLNFGGSHLKKINLFLPELNVQKKVSTLLLLIDNTIKNMQRKISILEQLTKSLFTRMFGDIKTNDKNWEIKKLGEVVQTQYGTSKKATSIVGKFPILRMNNITYSGEMDYKDLKYIELSDSEKEKFLLKKGELLFNRTNSKELVGKTGLFNLDIPMAFAGYLIRIKPSNLIHSKFLLFFMNSEFMKKLLYNKAKNIVGMANINAKELEDFSIILPPIELQNKFAERVEKIEKLKFTIWKIILKVYKILKKKGVEKD
ncbi:restriction endonuclease subunit S [Fusobacterium polymorphum]|jgi:hsdS, type I site-specific deoxyribonuclease (fragment)|uniref:restriction endonuclease subunit S n=1 Tax=Fusobacterium nucleatum subsp. polymorphum TaxID=76857 RepID=UPI002B4BFD48|nr:restriction endonuclease subunit S [Fusobacterium polymorphum]WRL78102.1 restriction endonuclease subunit S [Fusobacterium polymorphum]